MLPEIKNDIIAYGARGEERKRLVKAIAEYRETFSEYCGAPTFMYLIDDIQVDQNGTVIFTMSPDEDEIRGLTAYLADKGFYPEGVVPPTSEVTVSELIHEPGSEQDPDTEPEQELSTESRRLTLELPREGFTETALENLQKIIDSKASLLRKAICTDDLSIEITDERIRFPWFPQPADGIETTAYAHLVSALGEMAKKAKRVTAVDKPVESEKYAFRSWLLRLGFIGPEYKHERAILLKNLSGHAAFKNQADADAFTEKQRVNKAAARAETENSNLETA